MPSTTFFKGVGGSSLRVPFRSGARAWSRPFCRRAGGAGRCRNRDPVARTPPSPSRSNTRTCRSWSKPATTLRTAPSRCTRTCRTIWRSTTNTATGRAPSRVLPMPRTSCASTYARSGLPATRWSRSPASPLRRAPVTSYEMCLPTQGAADLKSALSGITGLARSVPHPLGRCRRRLRRPHEVYPEFLALMLAAKRPAGREMDRHPSERSPAIITGARPICSGSWRSIATDAFSRCASSGWSISAPTAPTPAPLINTIAAPTAPPSASTTSPPCTAGTGWSSPTRRRRRPIAAPAVQRRLSVGASGRGSSAATGIESIKLRRRNLLRKDTFPLKTPTGSTYDSADPERLLDHGVAGVGLERLRGAPQSGEACAASCAASGSLCFSSRPAAWARSRSSCGSSPTADCRCSRSRDLRGKATKPFTPHWWPDPWLSRGPHRAALQRRRCTEAGRRRHVRIALPDQPRRRA